MRRTLAPTTAALATALALIAPTSPASAAGTSPTDSATACEITGGQLSWGIKESFRAYISGTIANGTWEVTDGATYETPAFGWSDVSGVIDRETLAGSAEFTGAVHFTGHDGLLDTVMAHPTLIFDEDGTGRLLLDLSNVTMDDALAGDTENAQAITQASFITLDLASAPLTLDADGTTVSATAVATAITQEGFDAFGTYETGTAFDPLDVTLTIACPEREVEVAETAAPASEPTAAPATADSADAGWIGWLIGIVVIVVATAGTVWLALRRRAVANPVHDADSASDGPEELSR